MTLNFFSTVLYSLNWAFVAGRTIVYFQSGGRRNDESVHLFCFVETLVSFVRSHFLTRSSCFLLLTDSMVEQSLRHLTWNEHDHLSVLLQLHGSVWPRVWPFVVAAVLVQTIVYVLKENHIDLTASGTGHRYMGMVMSFLVCQANGPSQILNSRMHGCFLGGDKGQNYI